VTIPALDFDTELLISELSASLIPPHRYALAARAALEAAGCSGCGAAYRVLASLQRGYWDPPADDRLAHSGARRQRHSKLIDAEPIGPAMRPDRARQALWRRGA
jgi:hypothetical protein